MSKTRVRLADIHLYVFCQEYRQQNQRINRSGAFEIKFVSEEGKLFYPVDNGAGADVYLQRPNGSEIYLPPHLRTRARRPIQRPDD